MKQYGFYKTTEFGKKDIGLIYKKAKNGVLRVEKWFISALYDLAEFYGTDSNRNVEDRETKVLKIITAVQNDKDEEAQKRIIAMANNMFESYGRKKQQKCDRTIFVEASNG